MSWGSDLRSLYDVNFILALLDRGHEFQDLVSGWFNSHLEFGWASCPLTQNGYLRIRSQSNYHHSLSLNEAYDQLLDAISSPHHLFITDNISLLDDTLVDFRSLSSHRQLTDVYLLALAVAHNARLVTLDTRITLSSIRGATENHLAVLLNPST